MHDSKLKLSNAKYTLPELVQISFPPDYIETIIKTNKMKKDKIKENQIHTN
jgi:hypothetical protein